MNLDDLLDVDLDGDGIYNFVVLSVSPEQKRFTDGVAKLMNQGAIVNGFYSFEMKYVLLGRHNYNIDQETDDGFGRKIADFDEIVSDYESRNGPTIVDIDGSGRIEVTPESLHDYCYTKCHNYCVPNRTDIKTVRKLLTQYAKSTGQTVKVERGKPLKISFK